MLTKAANQRSAFNWNFSKSILIDRNLIFPAEVLRNSKSYQTKFYKKLKFLKFDIFEGGSKILW